MAEPQLSPTDAALRARITELSVHIPCGGLRGPRQRKSSANPNLPVRWQSCQDEDSPERWPGCDVSRERDLCIICFRATAGGISRWSWLACEDCRAINNALERAWGARPTAAPLPSAPSPAPGCATSAPTPRCMTFRPYCPAPTLTQSSVKRCAALHPDAGDWARSRSCRRSPKCRRRVVQPPSWHGRLRSPRRYPCGSPSA